MAAKAKLKKTGKAASKSASRNVRLTKSRQLKAKSKRKGTKPAAMPDVRRTLRAKPAGPQSPGYTTAGAAKSAPARTAAIRAYESGVQLMFAEEYQKAIKCFTSLLSDYLDEPEIQASARARIQACEKKLQERARTVFRSAEDHYNMAVALLNGGDPESAVHHLRQAEKLAPKSDHILYALAAANALLGNKDQALSYLRQSIQFRSENRFQAARDRDFAGLAEDPEFQELLAPATK